MHPFNEDRENNNIKKKLEKHEHIDEVNKVRKHNVNVYSIKCPSKYKKEVKDYLKKNYDLRQVGPFMNFVHKKDYDIKLEPKRYFNNVKP